MYTCMVFENIRVGVDVVHVEPLMFPGCKCGSCCCLHTWRLRDRLEACYRGNRGGLTQLDSSLQATEGAEVGELPVSCCVCWWVLL